MKNRSLIIGVSVGLFIGLAIMQILGDGYLPVIMGLVLGTLVGLLFEYMKKDPFR